MSGYFDINKSKAYAELTIYGVGLNLEHISSILRLKISYVRNKGDYIGRDIHGVEVSARRSKKAVDIWTYKTEIKNTYDLAIQVEELISVFKDKRDELRMIKGEYKDCTIEACVVLYNYQKFFPGFVLSADQISFFASIGVGLEFDIYLN